MPRNIEDIIPGGEKKSIRDIPIPVRKTSQAAPKVVEPPVEQKEEPQIPRLKINPQRDFSRPRRSISKRTVWIGGFLALFVLLFGVFSFFSGATLTYIPKSIPLTFNKDVYAAYKATDG